MEQRAHLKRLFCFYIEKEPVCFPSPWPSRTPENTRAYIVDYKQTGATRESLYIKDGEIWVVNAYFLERVSMVIVTNKHTSTLVEISALLKIVIRY